MKKKNLYTKTTILVLFFALLTSIPTDAQISFDNNVNDESKAAAPIDGFIGFGMVLGIIYGVRKLKVTSH